MKLMLMLLLAAQAPERFHCNLGALTRVERQRDRELATQLHAALLEQKELPDGYAFRFPAGSTAMLAEWVAIVSKCCQPVEYRLELGPQPGGALWLRMTGGNGVKEFLAGEFAALIGPR
jgi:hypothetical protein